jgi:fucose permease
VTHTLLLATVYLAFISLGLPDSVLGVAWPGMRASLGQDLASAGLITLVLTVGSALSSFVGGRVLARWGTGPVVTVSGLLTGLALLGFALSPSFALLLLLAVPLGLGAGAVDARLNQFVAAHYSARHMNWLHGCWGVGATLGPLIMASALTSATGWRQGYLWIGGVQLGLVLLFVLVLPLWQRHQAQAQAAESAAVSPTTPKGPAPTLALWLAPALYLAYAAVEISIGLWAGSLLVDGRGLDAKTAALWVSCFFGAIMLGRFATGLLTLRLGNRQLVRLGIAVASVGAALFSSNALPAALSLAGLVLMGLGCAPIYPCLMHETARRFEPVTAAKVIARQVGFAYVGAAIVPAALGYLAATAGLGAIMPAVLAALLLLLLMSEALNRIT